MAGLWVWSTETFSSSVSTPSRSASRASQPSVGSWNRYGGVGGNGLGGGGGGGGLGPGGPGDGDGIGTALPEVAPPSRPTWKREAWARWRSSGSEVGWPRTCGSCQER